MGHGCHTCGCPNGCECDEYTYSIGDWLEVAQSDKNGLIGVVIPDYMGRFGLLELD